MIVAQNCFLDALRCENRGRPPVWLMRQAGRYLPEYRALREKWSLRELFFTPELAAQVTMLPIDLLGVDAAILFSDISVVALSLGLKLDFREGPVIEPMVKPADVENLPLIPNALESIAKTIQIVKPQLQVPLIGFCGGPFTVASYLIEKHSGQELPQTKKWIYKEPEKFGKLLEKICTVSIEYLKQQVKAGVDAVQIFDSWAHVLDQEQFRTFCVPYLKQMVEALDVPVILFMRGSCLRVEDLVRVGPSAISFDWQMPLQEVRKVVPNNIAVQGNLDPDLLYAPKNVIRQKTKELCQSMQGDLGFVVNLGHGVKPDMPVDAVRCLIETVHSFRL